MPNYYSQRKYEGPEAVVVGIDIGTTQSAVSFVHLAPGIYPEAQMVTHWPELTRWTGDAKIPSIVSYRHGVVKACGAEALQDFEDHQEDVAYWFKLHLHPPSEPNSSEIPPLPEGTTIERVYADMMRYLMEHTRQYFEKTTPNGAEIWARVRDTIVIVLATPNAWDIREQTTLRTAAIMASLVTEECASELLEFVPEAEASVHHVLANKPGKWLRARTLFAVIDCGGSTVDTTIYRCISTFPLSLYEVRPSECLQTGGIFVDREIEKMLKKRLEGSLFSHQKYIKAMMATFERDVKPKFDGVMDKYNVKFSFSDHNDPSLGIHKGWITLSNEEITAVFDQVINKIVTSCLKVLASQKTEHVLIVGGFGESPYLRKILQEQLPDDMEVTMAGNPVKKAVAEGAIIGYIKQFVVARVARATFGGCVRELYNKKLHREHRHAVQVYADGKTRVDGAFHMWIKKGTVLKGTFAYKLHYHVAWEGTSTMPRTDYLKTIGIEVFAWEGDDIPTWCKDEHGEVMKGMRLICTLNADLSALAGALEVQTGKRGKMFYRVDYNVCVYFGGTQLRAKLQWKEKGVIREGPVTVMPFVS